MNYFRGVGRSRQGGTILIDALIAIVIFSVGILGMVSMQGAAVRFASDAQYRTQAAMLTDQIIAQMWGADPSTLAAKFAGAGGSGGPAYAQWAALIADPVKGLPGSTVATNAPSIVIGANNVVTVTVRWQAPNDQASHAHAAVTQITR